jgi:putative ABC transport system permease protein
VNDLVPQADTSTQTSADFIAVHLGSRRARTHGMGTLIQDLRYGIRTLAKSPGFTVIALLTLTLGIGATAAIFSVVDAVLLRSLPYREPERLVSVLEDLTDLGFPRNTPAPGNYAEWKKQKQIFEDVAAMAEGDYNLTGREGEPEKLGGVTATQNLFSVLGTKPLIGRAFAPEEDRPGTEHVTLISYRLWKRRFGGDPKLVGQAILLNNQKYSVLGVMPPGFSFPSRNIDIWTPIAFTSKQLANFGMHYLLVVGRLRPGVTVQKANAALLLLAKQMARQYPDTNAAIRRFFAEPLQESYTHDVRRGLIVLMAAVGFILLIACANIANLLLSRAAGRQREIAVRTALGADRGRIIRQLLTESALLAVVGGMLGVILANWCFNFLKNLIPADLALTVSLKLDFRVLTFAVLVSLMSSFLFGLAPALQVSKVDLNDVLKEGGRGSAGSRRRTFRNLLVVGEVALSLMLLVGSGLLLESFSNLRGLDPGFRSDHVLTMRLVVPENKYKDFAKRTEFFQRVLERVRTLPGVKVAGFTSALPLTWPGGTNSFTPEGMPLKREVTYDANDRVVTPGYFEAMRIPLRRGRLFNETDGKDAPLVAIINETMARKFWPGQDPIGKRFKDASPEEKAPWLRIVGVIGDVRQMSLSEPPRQEMYFPYWQAKDNWMVPRDLVIRTTGDPQTLASAARQAVWSIDRDQPVSNVMTLDDLLDQEVAQRRVQAMLLGALAGLALILACVGIYGVLSYVVTQRTQEIGVRVALGADAAHVFRTVASQGMGLTAIGIVTGLIASLLLSRLLMSLLFGVNPTDPSTYLGAVAVFATVALLACYIPARRAAKVDPMVALRYE